VADIHTYDIGTNLDVTLVDENAAIVDLSTSSSIALYLTKPGGTVVEKAMTQPGGGTDGVCRYTTIALDLDTHGQWRLQVRVVFPAGEWTSNEGVMPVKLSRFTPP